MKTLKRKIALLLSLCMVLTGITPAYADEVKEPKAAYEAITCEAEVSEGVAEEAVEQK